MKSAIVRTSWPRIDLIGKIVFDVIAILLLSALSRVIKKRPEGRALSAS